MIPHTFSCKLFFFILRHESRSDNENETPKNDAYVQQIQAIQNCFPPGKAIPSSRAQGHAIIGEHIRDLRA